MSDAPRSGRSLDPETLAAYVDGRLPPDERSRVEAELAADPDSYEWLVETMRAEEQLEVPMVPELPRVLAAPKLAKERRAGEGGPKVLPFYRRRAVIGVVGPVLAVAAALVLVVRLQPMWWQSMWGPAVDPRFEKLVAAVGEERYIEGRLTGGFKYGPLRPVTRGSGDLSNQNLALLAAAGELQKAAQADPSPENLHLWGVASLLLGQLDGAVDSLEEAASLRASDAQTQSDLSAAYLARAQSLGRPDDLPRALAAAERAIAADSSLIEPYFNKATTLERLSLLKPAIDAWQDYATRDNQSKWATEATERLERLRRIPAARDRQGTLFQQLGDLDSAQWRSAATSIVASYPRAAREWIEDIALGAWGRATLARDHTEDQWLERVRVVVAGLASRQADQSLSNLFSSVDQASSSTRFELARAHAVFAEARALYQDFKMAQARPLFEQAMVAGVSSPALNTYAQVNLAIVWYYEDEFERARLALTSLAASSHAKAYLSYEARCYWILGIIDGAQARFSSSLGRYRQALEIYEQLSEHDHVAAMHHLLADGLSTLGQPREAWAYLLPALAHWEGDWNPRRQYGALMTASALCRRTGFPEAVASILEAVVDVTTAWSNTTALFQAHLERARANAQVGRLDEARADLQSAKATFAQIADPTQRIALEGQWLRVESAVEGSVNPTLAVANLRRATEIYGTSGSSLQLIEIEVAAVRALRAVGRIDEAKTILSRGLDRIDEQREAVIQGDQRIAFLDRVWDLYVEAIELSLAEGSNERAFEIAERGRARTAFAESGNDANAVTISRIQSRLEPDEALVYFVALPRAWTAWVITSSAFTLREGSIEPVVTHTSQLARATRRADWPAFRREAAALSSLILKPMEDDLRGARRVAFCADGVLHRVPFAALPLSDGHYLVERAVPSWIPAARVMLSSPPRVQSPAIASIFAPSVRELGLPSLPAAAEESQRIAELYGVEAHVGRAATRASFLRALQSSSVVHFAGHAVFNAQSPHTSRLLLTAADDDQGVDAVLSSELERAEVHPSAVVVLAACSSAAPAIRRGEGALTLARPFLAKGARAVIATLWDIDDASVAGVFVDFHRGLRSGLDVSDALAEAQRIALRDPTRRDQFGWAALVDIER